MVHGGRAWRGWFPLDGELTSGQPDHKEGIYFGTEGPAGLPLHGPNLFPAEPAGLGPAVLGWIDAMTALGARLLRLVAAGLGLDAQVVRAARDEPTRPCCSASSATRRGWTTAGASPSTPTTGCSRSSPPTTTTGLQVHGPDGWIDVPSEPGVFVVNLGDMLDRMTEGRYRSTPHRVRNTTGAERLSFPCFIDPSWDARCPVLPLGRHARRPTTPTVAGTAPACGPGTARTAST